jgi:hypothetical protein
MNKRCLFEWHRQFKEGQENVLLVQDHACVFLQSQMDSSLRMHCTRANGESTVLNGSGDVIWICKI